MAEIKLCKEKKVFEVISGFTNCTDNNRYKSWELCYCEFKKAKDQTLTGDLQEKLSLHLMGYLASWGMYRGSTQLLKEYNYMVHKDLVPILLSRESKRLFDIDPLTESENFCKILDSTYKKIEDYYKNLDGSGFTPTKTLVTKILLGVYGCVPAYDINVYTALSYFGIRSNKFENLINAIKSDAEFISQCIEAQEKYPQFTFMKIVDMFLWEIGEENLK